MESVLTTDMVTISGTSGDVEKIDLVLDGNFSRKISAEMKPDGLWSVDVPLMNLVNGKHRITAFSVDGDALETMISDFIELELDLPAIARAEIHDKRGDDNGPNGTYTYPANPSFRGQMDIEAVKVYSIGNNLKIDVTMTEISQIWLPPNGFDHELINIYVDLPGREGISALPYQNAKMPDESAWNILASVSGFGNAIFTSEGASATNIGSMAGPAASISVDTETRPYTFLLHPRQWVISRIFQEVRSISRPGMEVRVNQGH